MNIHVYSRNVNQFPRLEYLCHFGRLNAPRLLVLWIGHFRNKHDIFGINMFIPWNKHVYSGINMFIPWNKHDISK